MMLHMMLLHYLKIQKSQRLLSSCQIRYDKADIEEGISEVNQLKEDGQLFTEDIYQPFIESSKIRDRQL